MIGDLVTGRSAENIGVGVGVSIPSELMDNPGQFQSVSDMLRWRFQNHPDSLLYSFIDAKGNISLKMSTTVLHRKAERVAYLIQDKLKLNHGDHVALVYPPGVDLIVAFHACFYIGVVPVIIRPPSQTNLSTALPTIKLTLEMSKSLGTVSYTHLTLPTKRIV